MGVKPYVVVSNERRGPYATVTVRGDVERSEPGQFYMLRGDWGADPMLPRPLSILGEDERAGTLRFLLKVVGEGTRRLYELEPGQKVTGLGPLGRPFPRPGKEKGNAVALAGGGVGVPPLVYLAEAFVREGTPFTFLQGARSKDDLVCMEELAAMGVEPVITTEDGSAGEKGLVTAPLQRALDAGAPAAYACGPEGMLKAVAKLCWGRVPSHLSLEARMGCGYGVCLGCVVPVLRGSTRVYERVCQEGPVFDGEVVLWE
jgi:dihydroorotate dehydrogenase electron transfer subunit